MDILEFINNQNKYHKILDDLIQFNTQNIYLSNTANNLSRILAAASFKKTNKTIVYTCENIYVASRAYEEMCDLLGADYVSFFPVEEFISSELVASSYNFRLARMLTLYNIINQKPQVIVTTTEGITKQMMSKDKIVKSIINIKVGDIYDMNDLVSNLIERGYKKSSITEEIGSFSVRGSIIDIYPINQDTLYRINFDFDVVETIKMVDVNTQLSTNKISEIVIFPLYDLYYEENDLDNIVEQIKLNNKKTSKIDNDIEKIKEYTSLDQLYIYLPYIDSNYVPFVKLFDDAIFMYENIGNIIRHDESSNKEINDYLHAVSFNVADNFFLSVEDIYKMVNKNILTSTNLDNLHNFSLDIMYNLQTSNNYEYNNNMKLLLEDIKTNKNRTYIITCFDQKSEAFLAESLKINEIKYNQDIIKENEINLVISTSAYGFIDYENNLEIITPNEYAPGKINKYTKYQKFYKNSTKVYDKDELKVGDYVVHQDYGIGIYMGIETKEIRGKKIDYIYIQFNQNGKLYVPVENIYLLEKYNTNNDTTPKLNSLSGKEWSNKKKKIKEKLKDVAEKLIKVQAERELRKGYIYSKDTLEQQEFENDFGFNETIDQKQAIIDVKNDMESSKPVDRLICGDVGFGKTEVAMRAAFKAVMDNKQVAYLAPTTVLTRQHYYTFRERFEKYGIRVELLNRLVPTKTQKEVIEGVKKGYVDILIGTHRILSKDIYFKDLGLLIIDEEQRFGVTHKEKIKELKANVDVLTLTATPIPRTLQMSLNGLKDLSLIETPPINRLPVQTYVLEANDSVIREAINRELGRNGQVFYLLNRIDEFDKTIHKIKRLVPDAKIGVIHGRMDKEDIERELVNFLDNRYNVLVCTTIIETGIDIPNANTLIIEKADILGLSQLYQIRGRVGRSDRISYAYLMYDPIKKPTPQAISRLEAIKEFTALGSGYKIAMRDLAIRGAGNILGEEQSGYIDSIGMDLYSKMLNDAINELKGIEIIPEDNKHYTIDIDRHIDKSYVSDEDIRIEIHRLISRIKSREEINALKEEFTDRYGLLSEDINIYMEEKYLEFLLKSRGVETFKDNGDTKIIIFDEIATSKLNFKDMAKIAKAYAPKFNFDYLNKKLYIYINAKDYEKSYIYTLTAFLEKITLNEAKNNFLT